MQQSHTVELLHNLDVSLHAAIHHTPQEQQTHLNTVYRALGDVIQLPRLHVQAVQAETVKPIVKRSLHHLVAVCPSLVSAQPDAPRRIVQYIDHTSVLSNNHHDDDATVALVCTVLTCASPPQLHDILPTPALDCIAHLVTSTNPNNAVWLLACTIRALDAAYTIPPSPPPPGTPEMLPALVSLDQLRRIGWAAWVGDVIPVLQAAANTAQMPQHAAATVAQSFTSASASIIASCSGLLAVMPVAHPTAMLSTAWYWSLALGGCALYTAHNAACVGQGRALVVLPQALAGRDAVHVVAHVLFEHALVVPAWRTPSPNPATLLALLHAPLVGPANPHPPAPPLCALLQLQLASLPPHDPATHHAHTMLHTVIRTGALKLFDSYRQVVLTVENRGALVELAGPLGALCRQAFDVTVGVLHALMMVVDGGERRRGRGEDGELQAWQGAWDTRITHTPHHPPPTPVYPLDTLTLAQQREGSVAEVLLQGHVQLERSPVLPPHVEGSPVLPPHIQGSPIPPPHMDATGGGNNPPAPAPPTAHTSSIMPPRISQAQCACAADTVVALSCVVMGRPAAGAPQYAHLLKHSLQVLGRTTPAQQWAPMSVIETWPSMEELLQPAPAVLGTGPLWQHDAVLTARMQLLLACTPPLCPLLPHTTLLTTILPIAQLYLEHTHPPCCDAALDTCCAALQCVDEGVREEYVPAVVGRLLEGIGVGWGGERGRMEQQQNGIVQLEEALQGQEARARMGIETCFKLLPSGSMASMRCVQLVLDHAVVLLSGGGGGNGSSGGNGQAWVNVTGVMGRLVGVCVLVIDYQMWYAALELVQATVLHEVPRGAAIALVNAMHGVLTMGDDYTRKLRLATWYTSLSQQLRGSVNNNEAARRGA